MAPLTNIHDLAKPIDVFQIFEEAIVRYLANSTKIQIVSKSILSPGGSVLNYGGGTQDIMRFSVRVQNNGKLGMDKVRLSIDGVEPFVEVSTSTSGPWGAELTSEGPGSSVLPHGGQTDFGPFYLRTTAVTGATAKDLIIAKISGWDANLNHILTDHSGAGTATAKITETIAGL